MLNFPFGPVEINKATADDTAFPMRVLWGHLVALANSGAVCVGPDASFGGGRITA
ncbi:hypothetical protein FKM82_009920 [Ascaphus truei]